MKLRVARKLARNKAARKGPRVRARRMVCRKLLKRRRRYRLTMKQTLAALRTHYDGVVADLFFSDRPSPLLALLEPSG